MSPPPTIFAAFLIPGANHARRNIVQSRINFGAPRSIEQRHIDAAQVHLRLGIIERCAPAGHKHRRIVGELVQTAGQQHRHNMLRVQHRVDHLEQRKVVVHGERIELGVLHEAVDFVENAAAKEPRRAEADEQRLGRLAVGAMGGRHGPLVAEQNAAADLLHDGGGRVTLLLDDVQRTLPRHLHDVHGGAVHDARRHLWRIRVGRVHSTYGAIETADGKLVFMSSRHHY